MVNAPEYADEVVFAPLGVRLTKTPLVPPIPLVGLVCSHASAVELTLHEHPLGAETVTCCATLPAEVKLTLVGLTERPVQDDGAVPDIVTGALGVKPLQSPASSQA